MKIYIETILEDHTGALMGIIVTDRYGNKIPHKEWADDEFDDFGKFVVDIKPSKKSLMERRTEAAERIADATENVIALPGLDGISALEKRVKKLEDNHIPNTDNELPDIYKNALSDFNESTTVIEKERISDSCDFYGELSKHIQSLDPKKREEFLRSFFKN